MLARGRAAEAAVYRVRFGSPNWLALAPVSAPFIARRLITSFDPDGLAWGTMNLPASAWEHAAASRGLEPRQRALAHNLARHMPHAI
jgi:hypothetical protein